MTPKTTPPVLAMFFTLVCALPAAGATIPSAIAQGQDISPLDEEEDLARSIISDVLDGGDDDEVNDDAADYDMVDQDSTETATVSPNQDQTVDQTDFNEFGDNTATNLDADQTESHVAVSIDVDKEDGGVVWCYERQGDETVCFNTQEQCELALAENELSTTSHCERFETLPPDAFLCVAKEGGISCIRE
jgi:uncharacterized protein (DUF1684 family)